MLRKFFDNIVPRVFIEIVDHDLRLHCNQAMIRRLEQEPGDGWDIVQKALQGRLDVVDPKRIAAMTEAPMLGEYAAINDDGSYIVDGYVWAYNDYTQRHPVDAIIEDGKIYFEIYCRFQNTVFPPLDTEAYLDFFEERWNSLPQRLPVPFSVPAASRRRLPQNSEPDEGPTP